MNLSDLIACPDGKTLSHTKLWANIGYAAATAAFIRLNWIGIAHTEVWLAYLGCVAGAATASKFLALKYGNTGNKGGVP
ncbi:MAG: hypothetical protein LBL72_07300 [Candidatus Accumulibacter sp.]|nr:hypothetical protein [Accumulibacter sp.]